MHVYFTRIKLLQRKFFFNFVQKVQNDVFQAQSDMDAVLKAGNELIAGRENVPGSKEVKDEMDILKDRMDRVVATSSERQKDLENKWNTLKQYYRFSRRTWKLRHLSI